MHKTNKQSGVSLLEGVVALFIFSLGALGLAAMQITSLLSSGESQQRSIVLWKAQEFVDRIRANESALATYITTVNNNTLDTIGVDSADNIIQCGVTAGYTQPATMCADTASAAGGSCTATADIVAYDVWDVFCNPNGGLGTVAANNGSVQDGSAGVSNLEVMLRQNSVAAGDPNDDVMLILEWLSRESEANTDIASTTTIAADVCDIPDFTIASSLNVYCLRFSL